MYKAIYSIIIISLLLAIACRKPEDSPDSLFLSKPVDKMEVIWDTPLNGQNFNYAHLQPLIVNNMIILGSMPANSNNETIYGFDKNSGHKIWEWKDYLNNSNMITKIGIQDNVAIISTSFRDYVFDTQTGATVWQYETPMGFTSLPRGSVIGNCIYHPWGVEHLVRDTIGWLMRSTIYHPQWDTVFTIRSDSGYGVSIEPPVLWMSPGGDSVVIFQNRRLSLTTFDERVDLLAYNLQTKTLNWKINDLVNNGESSTHALIVFNNQCIFLGIFTVYSFNLLNGQKLWEYTIPHDPAFNGLSESSCIIVNNKLYVKTHGDLFFCLNPVTGQLIWENKNAGANPTTLNFYKNKLYYIAGVSSEYKIICVDAENGNVLYTLGSPHANLSGNMLYVGGLIIDPVTNFMYFADSYYATCIKVPE
jgi:outer membrane protein assembly factor BamB